jgi:hypothetical protein
MKSSCTPLPVWLNGWKHHLGFVCREIFFYEKLDEENFKQLCKKLKVMGASLSDFYTGKLKPGEIAIEVSDQLKSIGVYEKEAYFGWIKKSEKKFREVTLSDHSLWTLVQSDDRLYYLHIHPSRYSPHTIRLKGNILRSAAALLAYEKFSTKAVRDVESINLVRKEYLGMSPLDARHIEGILKTKEFLKASCLNL